jgi:hypothetical protein
MNKQIYTGANVALTLVFSGLYCRLSPECPVNLRAAWCASPELARTNTISSAFAKDQRQLLKILHSGSCSLFVHVKLTFIHLLTLCDDAMWFLLSWFLGSATPLVASSAVSNNDGMFAQELQSNGSLTLSCSQKTECTTPRYRGARISFNGPTRTASQKRDHAFGPVWNEMDVYPNSAIFHQIH